MTVSLALDGKGLGAMWGKELATQMLEDAGFSSVEVKQHGVAICRIIPRYLLRGVESYFYSY